VELVRAFRQAARRLRVRLEVHGADATPLSPAIHHVDHPHLVPAIASGKYIEAVLRIVRHQRIDLLVPLIDSELARIARATGRFERAGCRVLISSPGVVDICRDKVRTFQALQEAGIDTPRTWTWQEAMRRRRHRFPYYLKPRTGSAAMGNYMVWNRRELAVLGRCVPEAIVQEFVEGVEHTLDIYTGCDGVPRCVVPRRRLEVRSGEVSKSLVVKDARLVDVGRRVATMLGASRGVITVQCMVTSRGRIRVIEINPRFGGGVPLSIHAGADFPRWILQELRGDRPRIAPFDFRGGVAMLRYDESVFVENAAKLIE
jgi:carbamoyl-phosphate synthase large subunit